MEKVVSLKVARLAKDAGFDLDVEWCYLNGVLKRKEKGKKVLANWNAGTLVDIVSAPTLKQLEEWIKGSKKDSILKDLYIRLISLLSRERKEHPWKFKREFKAFIEKDFEQKWLEIVSEEESIDIEECRYLYVDDEFKKLSDRISGKIVTLREFTRKEGLIFTESNNDNIEIYEGLFKEVEEFGRGHIYNYMRNDYDIRRLRGEIKKLEDENRRIVESNLELIVKIKELKEAIRKFKNYWQFESFKNKVKRLIRDDVVIDISEISVKEIVNNESMNGVIIKLVIDTVYDEVSLPYEIFDEENGIVNYKESLKKELELRSGIKRKDLKVRKENKV